MGKHQIIYDIYIFVPKAIRYLINANAILFIDKAS